MSRPRALLLGGALLVLLLALTPLIPRGERDGGLRPSGRSDTGDWDALRITGRRPADRAARQRDRPGRGRGPGSRQAGRPVTRQAGRARSSPTWPAAPTSRARPTAWASAGPPRAEAQVRARLTTAARARQVGVESTGDLDVLGQLARQAGAVPGRAREAERRELTAAARSVAKVWVLRHEIQGVPLPDGFLADHPEARAREGSEPSDDTTAPPCDCPTNDPAPQRQPYRDRRAGEDDRGLPRRRDSSSTPRRSPSSPAPTGAARPRCR